MRVYVTAYAETLGLLEFDKAEIYFHSLNSTIEVEIEGYYTLFFKGEWFTCKETARLVCINKILKKIICIGEEKKELLELLKNLRA